MNQEDRKAAVAQAAVEYIRPLLTPQDVLGIGTGSTTNFFIDALARSSVRLEGAVASSEATAARLRAHHIKVINAPDAGPLKFYVDSADEAAPDLSLIKGGGGALTREKIIAASSAHFVCIVDDSKCVEALGAFPLPLEIIPMAASQIRRQLEALGGSVRMREGFVTDNGNLILDVTGLNLLQPRTMERRLNDMAGVVCNGLFALRPADQLLIATDDGISLMQAPSSETPA